MFEKTPEQEASDWKQKYYAQLDLFDKTETNCQTLESILKKSVLRLSIAAEGQHLSVDRHLQTIRTAVKNKIDVSGLDNALDDVTALLLKLEDKKVKEDKKIVTMLTDLLANINFSDAGNKQKNQLIKKLSKTSDKKSDALVDQVKNLLSGEINQDAAGTHEPSRSGLLNSIFSSKDKADGAGNKSKNNNNDTPDYDPIIKSVTCIAKNLPWPDELQSDVNKILKKLSKADIRNTEKHLQRLILLVEKWPDNTALAGANSDVIRIDADDVSAVKHHAPGQIDSAAIVASNHSVKTDEPSAKEVLIHLLERLTVPPDLHEEVENLKQRIADENAGSNWKQLLKDAALLINNLRDRMQAEKHEFETFLQQITSRLQEMDNYLSSENTSLAAAEKASDKFDIVVSAQVKDIHNDMNAADDLDDLKSKVEKRLNVVSDHIQEYRISEQERYSNAQQNVNEMQSRLVQLEQESGNLKKLMIEKDKEAMFDVLTKIPNRLSYEKKALEEIARCKRFSTALSMVVWDIDQFKHINDTYGHKVGDKILLAVAQLLEERMRETDFIARYGGEEFVMFLPGTDQEEALTLTEALRQRIAACKFNHQGQLIKITISCGITHFIQNDDHESMFERADKALYLAKNSGRNQCVVDTTIANLKPFN